MDCKETDVFPLHRVFYLLKYFIALNSPSSLDVWVAAQRATFGAGKQISVLPIYGGKSSVLPFLIACCPKHGTTDHQMLASLCLIWPGQSISGFLCTDCSSRGELDNSQRKCPFPSICVLGLPSIHFSRSSTPENAVTSPCFLTFPVGKNKFCLELSPCSAGDTSIKLQVSKRNVSLSKV